MERNEKCFCGSGRKYKNCHYRINGESKLSNIYRKIYEYDKYCNEHGLCNMCDKNCSKCCSDYFYVDEMEFLTILEYMIHNKFDIDKYIEKAILYEDDLRRKHPEIIEKLDSTMPVSNHTIDQRYWDDTENPDDLLPCIFLNDNKKCSIYDVRPIVCRGFGTTEQCELIGNEKLEFLENQELVKEIGVVTSKVKKGVVVKRPYPLFYWFSFFMNPQNYDITMRKLNVFKGRKAEEYYTLCRGGR